MTKVTFDDIINSVLSKSPTIVATIDTTIPPPVPKKKKAKKLKEDIKTNESVGDFTDQDYPVSSVVVNTELCQVCGSPSKVGAHGIRDGKVYSEYYCFKHYNAKVGTTLKEEDDDEQDSSS